MTLTESFQRNLAASKWLRLARTFRRKARRARLNYPWLAREQMALAVEAERRALEVLRENTN